MGLSFGTCGIMTGLALLAFVIAGAHAKALVGLQQPVYYHQVPLVYYPYHQAYPYQSSGCTGILGCTISTIGAINNGIVTVGGAITGTGTAINGIAGGVGSAIGGIATGTGDAIGGIAGGAGQAIGGVASGTGTAIGGVASGTGQAVGGVASGTGGAIGGAASETGGAIGGAVTGSSSGRNQPTLCFSPAGNFYFYCNN